MQDLPKKTFKEKVQDNIDGVKKHLAENRNLYATAAVSAGVSSAMTILFSSKGQVSISNPAMVNYKPVANTIQVQMTRPGQKSFVVQCVENGNVWPSVRQAAKAMNISPSVIGGHLKGALDNAGGFHFIKLDEI